MKEPVKKIPQVDPSTIPEFHRAMKSIVLVSKAVLDASLKKRPKRQRRRREKMA
jgi:hypothetical protein